MSFLNKKPEKLSNDAAKTFRERAKAVEARFNQRVEQQKRSIEKSAGKNDAE
jgi:hypothetical protein